jgi:hypothetical protein
MDKNNIIILQSKKFKFNQTSNKMVELKKIQTMMVGMMFLILGVATSCSDGDEAILPEQASAKMPTTEAVVNKDSCMQLFSQILSKAVSQRQDVRMFL